MNWTNRKPRQSGFYLFSEDADDWENPILIMVRRIETSNSIWYGTIIRNQLINIDDNFFRYSLFAGPIDMPSKPDKFFLDIIRKLKEENVVSA